MSGLVLIVDDDADIRETLGELLELKGYQVAAAANGREALEFMRSGRSPCVVLLDLMMPVMDGYQFRTEQLDDAALASVPIVVVTAGSDVRKDDLKGTTIVPKPLNLDKLLAAIQQHCSTGGRH